MSKGVKRLSRPAMSPLKV